MANSNSTHQVDVEIQQAGLGDIGQLRLLEKTCFTGEAYGWATLLGLLIAPDVVVLKAVAGERVIGYVAGDPRPRRGYAWIVTLAVLPEFRRQRIGSRLLAECEVRLDMPRLRLIVRAGNKPALALYEKAGYRVIERKPRYYPPDEEDGLVMEKTVAGFQA